MSDLTVGQAVERLSQVTVRANIRVITRALRLSLGQYRFTEMVMFAQHYLLTKDMQRVVVSYSATIDTINRCQSLIVEKEKEIEATRRAYSSK